MQLSEENIPSHLRQYFKPSERFDRCEKCYICGLRQVFAEVWRVLRDDGTLWLTIGDSYANDAKWGGTTGGKHVTALHGQPIGRQKRQTGLKPKDLMGIPWRLALALQADGWTLRASNIWDKPSCMPESMEDRTTRSHEYVFHLAKSPHYFYDQFAIREPTTMRPQRRLTPQPRREGRHAQDAWAHPRILRTEPNVDGDAEGRNCRSVWRFTAKGYPGKHYATFPVELAERCIQAGTPAYGVCSHCGAPWRRLLEKERYHEQWGGAATKDHQQGIRQPQSYMRHGRAGCTSVATTPVGWTPACACNAPRRMAVVFDPFVGSGTTLVAARNLNRHGIGTDLSYAYLHDEARQRLGLAALADWEGRSLTPQPDTHDDLPLFALKED